MTNSKIGNEVFLSMRAMRNSWFKFLCAVFLFCAAAGGYTSGMAYAGVTTSNVVSRDLRTAGIEAYVYGILGGRSEYLINHPHVLGGFGREGEVFEIGWLYGIAYPATSWSWSGAVAGKKHLFPDGSVDVEFTKPAVDVSGGVPRSVSEWMFDIKPSKVKTEDTTRKFIVDNSGMMKMTRAAYENMKNTISGDIEKGLRWCLENKQAAKRSAGLRRHLERVGAENRFSSTVKLSGNTAVLLDRVMAEVFGVKR